MPDNQTKEEWLERPEVASNPSHRGTGVVLYRPRGQKEFIEDITYDEMLDRDERNQFFAFAWVPNAIINAYYLRQVTCEGRCSKTCKRPGCLCDRSIGICK